APSLSPWAPTVHSAHRLSCPTSARAAIPTTGPVVHGSHHPRPRASHANHRPFPRRRAGPHPLSRRYGHRRPAHRPGPPAAPPRLRLPSPITTTWAGESLVNDAAALVVYRFAVTAALGATFSLPAAMLLFPLVAVGGIAVGLLLAWLLHQIHERIEQPLIETAL